MGCNCGKRRMAQITSVNLEADSPTHADAAAKLAEIEAQVARAETVTVPDRSRTAARRR